MAVSLSPRGSPQAEMESQACSNRAAFDLWQEALGAAAGPCVGAERDSRLQAFAGRPDLAPDLLAALLFEADLRPDDLLWLTGPAPAWLDAALGFVAGFAARPQDATLWVAPAQPPVLPASVRRMVLTEVGAPFAVVWASEAAQLRESSAD